MRRVTKANRVVRLTSWALGLVVGVGPCCRAARLRLTPWVLGIVGLTAIVMTCWGAGPLDGIRAKIRIVPADASQGKSDKGFDDSLNFADGKFTSSAFQAKGFQPARYNGEREEHEAEFEVEQTNDVGEVVNWLGNIREKSVSGHATWLIGGHVHWRKKDGTKLSYYFNGTEETDGGSSTNATAAPPAHE